MRSMGQPIDRLHRDGPKEGKANQSEQVFRDGRAGNHPRRGTDYRQRGKDGQEPKIPKRHGSGLSLQSFDDSRPLGNDGHGPRENHDPKIMTDAGEFILRRQPFGGIGAPEKGAIHGHLSAQQSANCQRQGGLFGGGRGYPELSLNPQTRNKRDERLLQALVA